MVKRTVVQVNLCQKLFFSQNMGRTCCVQKLFWMSETISVHYYCTQHVLPRFELGIFMYWICNSMNNLPSWCGLFDAKRRTSDKDLPVQLKKMQLNKEKGLKRLEVMLEDMENVLVELKKMVDNCLTHTKLCDNPPPSVTLGKNLFLLSLIQIQIWQNILQNFGAQECLDSNLDW